MARYSQDSSTMLLLVLVRTPGRQASSTLQQKPLTWLTEASDAVRVEGLPVARLWAARIRQSAAFKARSAGGRGGA